MNLVLEKVYKLNVLFSKILIYFGIWYLGKQAFCSSIFGDLFTHVFIGKKIKCVAYAGGFKSKSAGHALQLIASH